MFLYIMQKKVSKKVGELVKVEESIQKVRTILEQNIEKYGLNSTQVIKWSVLMNKLINIEEKLKDIVE